MNAILMKIVLEDLLFFEFCGDSAVNPDVAVARMEDIVASLQSLSREEREEFLKHSEGVLLDRQRTTGDDYSTFLASLRDSLMS